MPGPILDALIAQMKQSDLENFDKKMSEREKSAEKVRPDGLMTIEEVMRRRAENIDMDFVDVPTSSEEVTERKAEEAVKTVQVDKDSNEMMNNFLNKLRG